MAEFNNALSVDRQTSQETLSRLYDMHLNGILCDAVINLDDGTKLHVHRAILSARSPFFK